MLNFATALDLLRTLRGQSQNLQDITTAQGLLDLQGLLLGIQVQVLEQQVEIRLLQNETTRLRSCLATARKLERRNGAYFLTQSDSENRGPYCVTCWDRRELLQLLVDAGDGGTGYCPNCKAKAGERRMANGGSAVAA